jgi:hypothetical protein
MISISIEARGVDEQIRKLEGFDKAYQNHTKLAMMKGVVHLEAEWIKIAPVYKGRYRQSLMGSGKVQSIAGGEVMGTVGTNVTHRGVSYPAVLESSERYHYRSGPRAGQKTAGQVKRVLTRSVKTIVRYFKMAYDGIVKELKV